MAAFCPKCPSGKIQGPTNGKGENGQEWQTYRCNYCGHSYRVDVLKETSNNAKLQETTTK